MRKFAAAARRVEEPQRAELVPELPQVRHAAAVPASLQPPELGPQVIEEQRLDHLQDVLLRRVVRPLGATVGRLHDRLEQRTEDGRRDCRPVELARVEQGLTHRGVEIRDAKRFRE